MLARLLALALLTLTTATHADLDVDVPPGVALSWPRPQPPIVDYGAMTGGRKVDPKPERGQGSLDPVKRPGGKYVERPGKVSRLDGVFQMVGIISFDLPGHLPWTRPGPPSGGRALVRPPASAAATGWRYPPVDSPHLHWLAVATLLRPSMHPQVVTHPGVIEQLVTIGWPAADATRGARTEPGEVGRLARLLAQHVGDRPARIPAPTGGVGTEAQMLHRLALYELASSYPDDPERPFARRLLSLGAEAIPPLLHYSRSAHPLVRRNAVAALGRLGHPRGDARLRALIADADRVVRNRAIHALARRRDRDAVPALITLLGGAGTDIGTLTIAAWALGQIGDRRAEPALLRELRAPGREIDSDALYALLPALARMPGSDAARKVLDRLERLLRRDPDRYEKPVLIIPTTTHKVTRAGALLETCALARAAWGETRVAPGGAGALIERLTKAARLAGRPAARRNGPERRRGRTLYGIRHPNLYLAIEVLAQLGEPGNRILEALIDDDEAHAALRGHAMEHLKLSAWMSFVETPTELARIAREHELGLVRERALRRLAELDESLAGDAAVAIVKDYADDGGDLRKLERHLVVMAALVIVGRLDRGPAIRSELHEALEQARKERDDLERHRERHWGDPNAKSPLDMTMVAIPPLLELALLELARAGSPRARPELLAQLRDARRPARAEAAIALGSLDSKTVRRALVTALLDLNPWVRFCAYRALRRLTDNNDPALSADWIGGKPSELKAAHDRWRQAIR